MSHPESGGPLATAGPLVALDRAAAALGGALGEEQLLGDVAASPTPAVGGSKTGIRMRRHCYRGASPRLIATCRTRWSAIAVDSRGFRTRAAWLLPFPKGEVAAGAGVVHLNDRVDHELARVSGSGLRCPAVYVSQGIC